MTRIRELIERSQYAVAVVQEIDSEDFGFVDLGRPPSIDELKAAVAPGRILLSVVGMADGIPTHIIVDVPSPDTHETLSRAVARHFTSLLLGEAVPKETRL